MKKFIFTLVAVLGLTFASCTGAGSNNVSDTDSVEVVVDSLATDSVVVDSVPTIEVADSL